MEPVGEVTFDNVPVVVTPVDCGFNPTAVTVPVLANLHPIKLLEDNWLKSVVASV